MRVNRLKYGWLSAGLLFFGVAHLDVCQSADSDYDRYAATNDINSNTHKFVARGTLLDISTNTASRTQFVTAHFLIEQINRGFFNTNIISVNFAAGSIKGVLPQKAILILEDDGLKKICGPATTRAWHGSYRALNNEAWRGILPDTPDAWARISTTPSEKLSITPEEMEISLDVAKTLSEEEAVKQGALAEWISVESIYRRPFGWLFNLNIVLPETNGFALCQSQAEINDSGEVCQYRVLNLKHAVRIKEYDAMSRIFAEQ